MTTKALTFDLVARDADADSRVSTLTAKLDEFKARFSEISSKFSVDDADGKHKINEIQMKMDALSRKVASPKIKVDGAARAAFQLDALNLAADKLDKSGNGFFSRLSDRFSGLTSKVQGLTGAISKVPWSGIGILAALAAGASMLPALVPTGIGLGVGAVGAYGAYKLDPSAFTSLFTDLKTEFLGALTSDVPGPVHYGHAQGQGVPGTSFMAGIVEILKQVDGWVKQIGPGLADMFRASLPFLATFTRAMEQLAEALMPAFTQSMNAMKPYLPQLLQGFKSLAQGAADFIKDLGPGMGDAVEIFDAACLMAKGVLIGLAAVCNFAAHQFVDMANWAGNAGHAIRVAFDAVSRWLSTWGRAIWETITQAWDAAFRYVEGSFQKFGAYIAGSFEEFARQCERFGEDIINGVIHGIENAVGTLIHYVENIAGWLSNAFKSVLGIFSPSKVFYEHGQNIVRGLVQGLDAGLGSVHAAMSRVTSAVSASGRPSLAVAGAGGSAGAGTGAVKVELEFVGSDAFTTFLKKSIRTRGGNANIVGR